MKIRVNRFKIKLGSKYRYNPEYKPSLKEYSYIVIGFRYNDRYTKHYWMRNDSATGFDDTVTLENDILHGKAMFI